jgi:sRNA-binding protein
MTEESYAATINRISTQLSERWPDLFNTHKPVPLAIGIHSALHEAFPDVTAAQLRRVLAAWCRKPRYLSALQTGTARHGLQGVDGEVTEAQAADAAKMLKGLKDRFKQKAIAKKEAEKAMQAAAQRKAERLKAKEEEKAKKEKAKQEEQARKAAEQAAAQAKKAAAAKPAGPVVIVKKRRFTPPAGE